MDTKETICNKSIFNPYVWQNEAIAAQTPVQIDKNHFHNGCKVVYYKVVLFEPAGMHVGGSYKSSRN